MHTPLVTSTAVILAGLLVSVPVGNSLDAIAPTPIDVHDLHLERTCSWAGQEWEGCIAQDRTVTPSGGAATHSALWAAQIVDLATGDVVPWCEGAGGADYRSGRATVLIPLPLWVGAASCTLESLPPGQYLPRATWRWGVESETHAGSPFTVEG